MARSALFSVLMCVFLLLGGAQCLDSGDSVDLPWHDELCCDSLLASDGGNEKDTKKRPHHCLFRGSNNKNHPREDAAGTCVDILCMVDEGWLNVTCDLQWSRGHWSEDSGLMAVKLHRSDVDENPVVCAVQDSFMCSFTISTNRSFVAVVTVSLSDATAPSVQLLIPAKPVKLNPPAHLSHLQTIEAELIVQWNQPTDAPAPFRYQLRHAFNTTNPDWKVSETLEPRLSLDLMSELNYSVQVRCSQEVEPPLWSEWSQPHHIYLYAVSYIPEEVVVQPGDNVSVYCVINDHRINASAALWTLNIREPLHHSPPVSQWVSQITVRPSESQMYDVLQCTPHWTLPYSQIYVQGALIDIHCETNGDIDAMQCNWTNTALITPVFHSKWADMLCDEMEEKESEGEEVGEMGSETGSECPPHGSTCNIQPLRMNCYKLWLEIPSPLGPIRSKPVYLTPIDHVKPHPPTNVKAVIQSSEVLRVSWEPPSLPTEGLQCQIQYCLSSNMKAQPDWKLLDPVWVPRVEVEVSDMCSVYVVQVRCRHTTGTGYWSTWSHSVDSRPENSRVPERGPDFWRIQRHHAFGKAINITLLFEDLSIPGCVDGFVVQRQTASSHVIRRRMSAVTSYSFEWDQETTTVSVEAYNSEGSSSNNINMTLEKQPTYRCVRSFHVSVINSSCVCVSWTLWTNSSKPVFMVLQWVPHRTQDEEEEPGKKSWRRLPYTEQTLYLKGDFFGIEDFGFYLFPVFADGEGEPAYISVSRRDPGVYLLLPIVSFVSIALFVTVIFTQHRVKRFVWREVPNPKMCSWAKGVDFKKTNTFHHLLAAPEGRVTWPLLLPPEKISKVLLVDQTSVVCLNPDHHTSLPSQLGPDVVHFDTASSIAMVTEKVEVLPVQQSSSPSCVTYATVHHSDPKHQQKCVDFHDQEGGGSSSSDEGNFSASSDMSGSFSGGLWELDTDDPRRSCSYNSVEELSESSEHEDGSELYYVGVGYPAEDEEEEEEDEEQPNRKATMESHLLLYQPQFTNAAGQHPSRIKVSSAPSVVLVQKQV